MTASQQLLADYVRNGSEEAFRELVTRYLALVYSTAIRLVNGDTHLAKDISQAVFVDLARKASKLPSDVMLGGWLHRDACFVASKMMRAERRRRSREKHAVEMNSFQDHCESDLMRVAPLLDDAINRLGAEDRAAILLRFFEQRDFRSVGEALGSTEDAARMRVNRALEKLRSRLTHRGVILSVAALGTVLTVEAVTATPVGLVAKISSVALASTAVGAGTTFTFLKAMTMTKFQAGIISAVVVASVLTPLVIQHQSQVKLWEENQSLHQQIAQLIADNKGLSNRVMQVKAARVSRPLTPPTQVTSLPGIPAKEGLQTTNRIAEFLHKPHGLTPEQVESYLTANRRSAASLLAAYREIRNPALLEEAMRNYPDDPLVDFEAGIRLGASAEQRRPWLDALKQSAPDNALANYLLASDYFKAGQTDQAMQELTAAEGKSEFQDYTANRIQDDEEAYLAAGYSAAEAKAASRDELLLQWLNPLKGVARDLVSLAKSYQQTGNEASAQAALQMGTSLGQRLDAGGPAGDSLMNNIYGIAIQSLVLAAVDPNSPYDNGQTVQDRLNQLTQQRVTLQELSKQADSLEQTMSDQDWISFTDRCVKFGEAAAMRWLVNKNAQK